MFSRVRNLLNEGVVSEGQWHNYIAFMFVISFLTLLFLSFLCSSAYRWYQFKSEPLFAKAVILKKDVKGENEVIYSVGYFNGSDSVVAKINSDLAKWNAGDTVTVYYMKDKLTADFEESISSAHGLKTPGIISIVLLFILVAAYVWPMKLIPYLNGEIFSSS